MVGREQENRETVTRKRKMNCNFLGLVWGRDGRFKRRHVPKKSVMK